MANSTKTTHVNELAIGHVHGLMSWHCAGMMLNMSMAAPVDKWVRSLYFSALNHSIISPLYVSGVGSSPALATCETRQVLLAGVSGVFPGVLPFHPTYRLTRLYE